MNAADHIDIAKEHLANGNPAMASANALVAIAEQGQPIEVAELIASEATIWVAYYSDFSGIAVFNNEIDAHRHANGSTMEVIGCRPGDVRDQINACHRSNQT